MAAPMSRSAAREPKPTLGGIVRDCLEELWDVPWLDDNQRSVLRQVAACGTDDAGLVQIECQDCGDSHWRPMSCQNRHCPGCGAGRADDWAQARRDELLDVPYFHATFAIPQQLHVLCRENPAALYALLFAAVQLTLKAFAAQLGQLGGTPAFLCVLHTADRRMDYYPHVHVLIAGATFDEATGRLAVADADTPLFPADALADAFRDHFLDGLRKRFDAGALSLSWKKNQCWAAPGSYPQLMQDLAELRWRVWLQPSAGDAETTIRYLAHTIQRTAITNARIVSYDGTHVTFRYKHNRTAGWHTRRLPRLDFIRLYAQHILPKAFLRVRYFGLLCPAKRKQALPRAKAAARRFAELSGFTRAVTAALQPQPPPPPACPVCQSHRLRAIAVLRGHTLTILHAPSRPRPPPTPGASPGREAA